MAVASRPNVAKQPIRNRVLLIIAFALFLYLVLPQVDNFSDSLAAIRTAQPMPVLLAVLLTALTFVAAACTYQLLALKKLVFRQTLAVQAAGAFANRILPAGIGGLTLNIQYLRKARCSVPQALAIAGTNNTLGLVGHLLLLLLAVVLAGDKLQLEVDVAGLLGDWYWLLVAAGVIGVLLLAIGGLRHAVWQVVSAVGLQFAAYRRYPLRLSLALCSSIVLTALHVLIFYLAGMALDTGLTVVQALVVFSAGMLLGTVTPTPGGLGGVEAGLVAGAVAYGFDAAAALAMALLYRLITYWLPLLPGFVVFMLSRRYYA